MGVVGRAVEALEEAVGLVRRNKLIVGLVFIGLVGQILVALAPMLIVGAWHGGQAAGTLTSLSPWAGGLPAESTIGVSGVGTTWMLTFLAQAVVGLAYALIMAVVCKSRRDQAPSLGEAWGDVQGRLKPLTIWFSVVATATLALGYVEGMVLPAHAGPPEADPLRALGSMVGLWPLRIAWWLATVFIVPAIIADEENFAPAVRSGLRATGKRWGEILIAGVLVTLLMFIPTGVVTLVFSVLLVDLAQAYPDLFLGLLLITLAVPLAVIFALVPTVEMVLYLGSQPRKPWHGRPGPSADRGPL